MEIETLIREIEYLVNFTIADEEVLQSAVEALKRMKFRRDCVRAKKLGVVS